MNTTDVRKKLALINAPLPTRSVVMRFRGETFMVIASEPDYADRAAGRVRLHGYWAQLSQRDDLLSMLFVNFAGTEWQDGMIPENLAALPLRDAPPKQTSMFDEGEA